MMGRSWPLLAVVTAIACSSGAEPEPLSRSTSGIIGGVPAPDASNIFLVYDETYGATCTGALIAPNVVAVARNCVSDYPDMITDTCVDVFGATHAPGKITLLNPPDGYSGTTWKPTRVEVPDEATMCGTAVALLVLGTAVEPAVAVPMAPRLDSPVVTGETFTAYGYGSTSPSGGGEGTRRMVAGVEVLCGNGCSGLHSSEWTGGQAACMGDGPAVDTGGMLIGLAVRGDAQCESSTYQGLVAHADWLREKVVAAAKDVGQPPPAWATGETDGGMDGSAGSAGTGGTSGAGGEGGSGPVVTGGSGGSSGSGGSAGSGPAGSSGSQAPSDEEDSGCSCSLPSRASASPWLLALIGLGLLLRRRGPTH